MNNRFETSWILTQCSLAFNLLAPGKGTTDAIFILRQLQEKFLSKGKKLYFAFVDLEKAFDRVPRKVLWWALRKVGVPEWIVRVVMVMYENSSTKIRVNGKFGNNV